MEYGTYLRMIGNYKLSDLQLAKAQKIIDMWLYSWKNTTTGNISTTATNMLLNDNVTDYEASGYEKTMLSTYRALNHIDDHNCDNARIEIKKMYELEQAIANYNQALYMATTAKNQKQSQMENSLYQQIINKYDFSDINKPDVLALKNSYQNAFSHYLAGFVFEALNEPSLSRPGYLQAGKLAPLNKLPQHAIDDIDNNKTRKKGYANVLIIQEVGHAPQIQSNEVTIPFAIPNGKQSCVATINVFFPKLIEDKTNTQDIPYLIDGKTQDQELFTNFDLMARKNLSDNIPHIIQRNITSAIRNVGTSMAGCSTGDSSTGLLLNLTSIVTGILLDRADERSWVLLPNKVYLNRLELPFGSHDFFITVGGRDYRYILKIDSPYQIINMRILNNQLFINNVTNL